MNFSKERLVSFLLRMGIGLVFFYAAVAAFITPDNWVGFFPQWLHDIIPGTVLLPIFSTYEILLALWLISGKHTYWAALLAAATLLAIVLPNILVLDVIFRDIAILFSALALAALSKPQKTVPSS
jgi:hypothetical protein